MIIEIRVVPGAKKCLLKKEENGAVKAYLTAPPVEGKANEALVELLADHYGVRKSRIEIIKGLKSRNKIINIRGI